MVFRTSSLRFVAAAFGLSATFCVSGTVARAQSADQDAAYQVVTRLFDAMRARDTAAMRSAFVANAAMQSLHPQRGVSFETIDNWLLGVSRAPAGVVIDERLANPVIHVDGDLASIWVDYWLFVGERFSHCGVDAFLLHRQEGRWRVFSVVDTRRTTGCAPAPQSGPN
jgi:hypothetical protein